MPGLGFRLSVAPRIEQRIYQRHEQKIKLDHKQKLQLKQLLKLELKLRHPYYPAAKRGIDGMIEADERLREQDCAGLLIGGLAEAVWGCQRTQDELAEHKDVDVLVLSDDFAVKPFEGGIDWWVPERRRVNVREAYTSYERSVRYFKNCNGVILNFSVAEKTWPVDYRGPLLHHLGPGLHLPDRQWIGEMRVAEILAQVENIVEIDPAVIKALEQTIDRRMGFRLPPYLERVYERGVVSGYLHIERFERPLTRAINGPERSA